MISSIDVLYQIFSYGLSISSRNISKSAHIAFWKSLSTNSYINIFNDNNYELINKNKHLLHNKDYIICKLCIKYGININIITTEFSEKQLNKLFKTCIYYNNIFMTKKLSDIEYTYSKSRSEKLLEKSVICNNQYACKNLMNKTDMKYLKQMFLLACKYKSFNIINILHIDKKFVAKKFSDIVMCGNSVMIAIHEKYNITKKDFGIYNIDILYDKLGCNTNIKFIKYIYEKLRFTKEDIMDVNGDLFDSAVKNKDFEFMKYLHSVIGIDCDLCIESIEKSSDEIVKYMFDDNIICEDDINKIEDKKIKKRFLNIIS